MSPFRLCRRVADCVFSTASARAHIKAYVTDARDGQKGRKMCPYPQFDACGSLQNLRAHQKRDRMPLPFFGFADTCARRVFFEKSSVFSKRLYEHERRRLPSSTFLNYSDTACGSLLTYGHTKRKAGLTLPFFWCARRESNPEPTASEAVTLSNCATDTYFVVFIIANFAEKEKRFYASAEIFCRCVFLLL